MSISTTRPRIAVVQHHDEGPPGLLEDWARTRGVRLDVARPDRGVLPDLGDADALVVLGSEASAIPRQVDWIDRELVWLARISEELPVLGICFGAQALAVALGGGRRRALRPEIGWIEVRSHDEALLARQTRDRATEAACAAGRLFDAFARRAGVLSELASGAAGSRP